MEKDKEAKREKRAEKLKNMIGGLQDTAAYIKQARERARQLKLEEKLYARIEKQEALAKADSNEIKRVIKEGTPEERAALFIKSYDNESFGVEDGLRLTEAQKNSLRTEIESDTEDRVFMSYIRLFFDLRIYHGEMIKFVKLYQVSIGGLVKLVTQWDDYEKTAMILTSLLVGEGRSEEEIQEKLNGIANMTKDDLVCYKYDQSKKVIVADIFFKGGLYEKIKEEKESSEECLSMAKATLVVIDEYLRKSKLFFLIPISMQYSMDVVKKELYSRSLISKRHHISELNRRKDRGEPVTPEEELLAVVPDYYDIEPDNKTIEKCKNGFKRIRTKINI